MPAKLSYTLGLFIFGAGLGCDISMASALIGILDGKSIVYTNSLIGAVQETGRLLGAPVVQGVWSYTLHSEHNSLGLPFGIIAVSLPWLPILKLTE